MDPQFDAEVKTATVADRTQDLPEWTTPKFSEISIVEDTHSSGGSGTDGPSLQTSS